MIFLSYTHADKPLVDEIARRLSQIFDKSTIFYDSWSIQPGDGIIDRMNAGLNNCKYFFFFVSKHSLQSKMVSLEWQNALLKATKGDTKIIPVRIDDVLLPAILLQTLYIDIFTQGIETGLRQILDVIEGRNTYRDGTQPGFQNIRAYVTYSLDKLNIEIRAEAYMEPHSRYLVLFDNTAEQLSWAVPGELMVEQGFNHAVPLEDGRQVNALLVARSSATSPGFPFVVEITAKTEVPIIFRGVMRIASREKFVSVPIITVHRP